MMAGASGPSGNGKGSRAQIRRELIHTLERMGYPAEFGEAIATSLGTEKTMYRMIQYLRAARPDNPEEIADEMLAILSDRERWVEKKKSEYYNQKYNEYRFLKRLEEDDEDDWDEELE